jgi:signal peptidase II
MTPRDVGLSWAVGALALDQGSKALLLYGFHFQDMAPGVQIHVLPFLNLGMVWNSGISYGLFQAHGFARWLLVGLAFGAIAALFLWLSRTRNKVVAAGLGMIIGGAVGNNLIDRVVYGRVADFFHFYLRGFDWYVFNVADCAITLGVVALLYDALLRPESATGETNEKREIHKT